jgi:hypothetical protein
MLSGMSDLFANAEPREDSPQDIIGYHLPADLAQLR